MAATSIRTALFVAACVLGLSAAARADIYTWTDEAGKVNVSNLKPPEGVRVTKVVREAPRPVSDPRTDALYRQQVEALSERVRQLESELQAPPPVYPPPPVVVAPVINVTMAAPEQYAPMPEPEPASTCDPSWYGCGAWWGASYYPAVYPTSTVVTRIAPVHRRHRFDGRVHPTPYQFGSVPLAPVGQTVPSVRYVGAPGARPLPPGGRTGHRGGR